MEVELQKVEIKDEEDGDGGSIATCRISLQSDEDEDEDLISPCMCKGTQSFVHRSCLDQWRFVMSKTAFSHCTTCQAPFHLRVVGENSWHKLKFRLFVARDVLCMFLEFQSAIGIMGAVASFAVEHGVLRNSFNDSWFPILSRHTIPFYYCIGVLVFVVLFYLIGFSLIIWQCCLNINSRADIWHNCRGGFDSFPFLVKACFSLVVAVVGIFVLAGLLGIFTAFAVAEMAILGSWQRHYNIFTKKKLTQEYVVEDLKGCYTPAKMDEEQMECLKMQYIYEAM